MKEMVRQKANLQAFCLTIFILLHKLRQVLLKWCTQPLQPPTQQERV